MTAPALVSNAPADDSSPFAVDNAIASITQDAVAQTLADNPDTAPTEDTQVARDEKGRFVPRDTDAAASPNAPLDASTPVVEPEPPALPEGMVAVPAVKDRALATSFKVVDQDGELEVPDLTIEFTANGRMRREPLDKVVRLAERGFYNEERDQAAVQARQDAQAVQQQSQRILAYAKQLEAERDQMLSSDDAYLMARARYEAANTPQARLEAQTAQVEQERTLLAYDHARQVSNQFFEGSVLPAVTTITQHLPEVSADEIGARLVLMTNHLRVPTPHGDTMIPPNAIDAVKQIIAREIVPWAQQIHETRAADKQATRASSQQEMANAKAEADKQRINAQRKTNLVGRTVKPGAANGSTGADTPKPKAITNIDDAQSAALDATFAAMGMERPRGS